MKNWIIKAIIVCLLVLFGFILGVTTQSVEANSTPNVTNVQNVQSGVTVEEIYKDGRTYIIFKYGDDIEVLKKY